MKKFLLVISIIISQVRFAHCDQPDDALNTYHERLILAQFYLLRELAKDLDNVPLAELERRRDLVTLDLFYYWYSSKKTNKVRHNARIVSFFTSIIGAFPVDDMGNSFSNRFLKPPAGINRSDFFEGCEIPIDSKLFIDLESFEKVLIDFKKFLQAVPE